MKRNLATIDGNEAVANVAYRLNEVNPNILYSGLTGRISRLTKASLTVVICESLIFFGNGRRCPVTALAEDLGSEHGTVGDIFLPGWFARRIPEVSSMLVAIGLAGMGGVGGVGGMGLHRLFGARRNG